MSVEPAQQEIHLIGNGRLRVVAVGDPHRGNGLKLDVHYLPNQGRNVTDPSEYETFDEEWSRVLARIRGETYWTSHRGLRDQVLGSWSEYEQDLHAHLHPEAEGVAPGPEAHLEVRTPEGWWTVLFRVSVEEADAEVFYTLLPLRARAVQAGSGEIVVEPAREGDPWLVVRGPVAGAGLPPGCDLDEEIPAGLLWVSGPDFAVTFGRSEEEALRRAAAASDAKPPWKKHGGLAVGLVLLDDMWPSLGEAFHDSVWTLAACVREDGQLPAAVYKGYNDCWVRDGVFCALGLLWAGEVEVARRMISYLAREVPVKEGELEEHGMLAYAVRAHWVQTGDDSLAREAWERIESGIEEVLSDEERFIPELGLFVSHREGFWERDWLGPAVNLTQNLWMRELCGVRYTLEGGRLEPHVPERCEGAVLWRVRFREHEYTIALNGHGSRVRRIRFDGREIEGNLLPRRSGRVEVELTPRGS